MQTANITSSSSFQAVTARRSSTAREFLSLPALCIAAYTRHGSRWLEAVQIWFGGAEIIRLTEMLFKWLQILLSSRHVSQPMGELKLKRISFRSLAWQYRRMYEIVQAMWKISPCYECMLCCFTVITDSHEVHLCQNAWQKVTEIWMSVYSYTLVCRSDSSANCTTRYHTLLSFPLLLPLRLHIGNMQDQQAGRNCKRMVCAMEGLMLRLE